MFKIVKPSDKDLKILLKDFKMKSVSEFKKALMKKKEEMLVIKQGAQLLGVVKFKNLKTCSRIESFYLTKKKLKGKGIAQKLYESYEKRLKNKKRVELWVYLKNKRAQGFWKKNDFKIIKQSKDDKVEEMYCMRKKLYS